MYRQQCNVNEQARTSECVPAKGAAYSVRGFGLIELLVTLSLVAIISTLAVPSFAHMLNQARLRTATNNFVAALYGARSHAIRTGKPTLICPSAEKKDRTCDNSGFDKGWIITTEPKEAKAVLRAWPAPKVTVSPRRGNERFFTADKVLQYLPDGRAHQTPSGHSFGSVMFCIDRHSRAVIVSYSGRIRVESGSC